MAIRLAEIARSLERKARDGDPNVVFAWRLSVHRKGYVDVRLEAVTAADAGNAD